MTNDWNRDMAAATELTKAGRVAEATTLLQRLLGVRGATNRQQAGGKPQVAAPAIDASATEVPAPPAPAASGLRRLFGRRKPLAAPAADAAAKTIDAEVLMPEPERIVAALPAEVLPSGGQFIAQSFTNTAGTRNYKLFIPAGQRDPKRPLILMLHGCAQSPDDFAAGTRMNKCAQEHGCYVAYPEQTKAANASKCWNWFNSADQVRGSGEPSLLAGIAQAIAAEHNIDTRRIYVAGLSAGGAAAAVLAETYPDVFAAIGVHSGLACGSARDMTSAFMAMGGKPQTAANKPSVFVPTIVFHGDRDTTVHPRNAADVVARAQSNVNVQTLIESSNAAGRAYTRSVYRDRKGVSLIEDWQIHGAGHAWSGGCTKGSFADPKGPDASREMLRFFLEHTLPV